VKKSTKRKIRDIRFNIRSKLFILYSTLKYNVTAWRYLNSGSIKKFESNRPELSVLQTSILSKLNQTGIAVTDLETLFPDKDILAELNNYLEKRAHRNYVNKKKPFLEDLLAEVPDLGTEVPFFNIAISPNILDVVNSYMGMYSRLFYYSVRRTKLSGSKLPSHSQNWHRATQEQKNCRVYIYLNDVDETSGPFMYVSKSTRKKKYGHVAPQTALSRGYYSAEVVEAHIPESDRKAIVGKAGTVIFCDSTGLHRGGYSNENVRTMSTFGFGAPSFRENINYSYPEALRSKLSDQTAAQEALNPKWQR